MDITEHLYVYLAKFNFREDKIPSLACTDVRSDSSPFLCHSNLHLLAGLRVMLFPLTFLFFNLLEEH